MKRLFVFYALTSFMLFIDASAQTSFLKYYAGSGNEDVSFSAVTKKDDSYFAIGNEGNKILIVQFDATGEVLSSRTIKLINEAKTPVCRSASFDKYGNLDICGYRGSIGTQSTYEAFVLAYNYESDTILWMYTLEATGEQGSAFNKVHEVNYPVTKEFVCGYTSEPGKNEEASWWGIDPLTGFLIQHDKLNNGSGRDEFVSFARRNSNMQILVGTFDYSEEGDTVPRPIACRYGPTKLWMQKGYLREVSSPARIYANDITANSYAPVFAIASGDGSGSETNKDLYYFKFNSGGGDLNLIRKIEFPNYDYDGKLLAVRQVSLDDNNHLTIVYGNKNDPSSDNHLGDVFIVGMFDHNQLSWAKSYPFTCHADGRGVDAMILDEERIFVVGRKFDELSNQWMGSFMRLNIYTGSLPNCDNDEVVELLPEPNIQLLLNADKVPRSDGIGSGKTTLEEATIVAAEECSGLIGNKYQKSVEHASVNEANRIPIFPNPTSSTIHLQLPSIPTTITLFNFLGEKVKEEKVSLPAGQAGGGEITMDVSELPAGLYFVRTGETTAGKFVKE